MTRPVAQPARVRATLARLRRLQHVWVACSGGLDSVCLADLASQAGVLAGLLHVNHHLRPTSHQDEALVRGLAARLGVPAAVAHLDGTSLRAHPAGLEAAARESRYRALATLVEALAPAGARVVTAHHANDRLETLLLRLEQGAGLRGLAGPRYRARLFGCQVDRPLLEWWRPELTRYATERGLGWIEDPMNAELGFARVRLREQVVRPWLVSAPAPALSRSMALLADDAQALAFWVDRWLAAQPDADADSDGTRRPGLPGRPLRAAALRQLPPRVQAGVVQRWLSGVAGARPSRALVEALLARLGQPGPFELHGEGLAVQRVNGMLVVRGLRGGQVDPNDR